ncbi:hypothetical protein RB653_008546 [Dictyostelium firmibasis]|uniref:Aminoglycoside phosphotransferase domain-containing protein n=1 Tax=Dictyostelium firmibasis TaxID=79012 RepID=A0AAN7YU32_9MYCE
MVKSVIFRDDLTIEFIESIIKDQLELSINISDKIKLIEFKIEEKLLEGGLMGEISRIYLKWDNKNDDSTLISLPSSIVIKSIKNDSESCIVSSLERKTYREVDFYQKQMKSNSDDDDDDDVDGASKFMKYDFLPIIYYAKKDNKTGEYSVIMQDLSGYISACKAMGNQCWGKVDGLDLELYDQFEIVKKCFLETSKIHIENWRDSKKLLSNESNSWLKDFDIYQGNDCGKEDWIKKNYQNLKSIWEEKTLPIIKKIQEQQGSNSQLINVDQVLEVVDIYFNHYLKWDQFKTRIDKNDEKIAFSLIHGDFHAGNVMVPYSENKHDKTNKLYLLDFSEIGFGCPFSDMAQFIISNCGIEFRRENEEKLFKIYWNSLVESGKIDLNNFPFDYCFRIYKRGGIDRWIMINILMSPHIPEFAIIHFFNQLSTFIKDHYSNDLFN